MPSSRLHATVGRTLHELNSNATHEIFIWRTQGRDAYAYACWPSQTFWSYTHMTHTTSYQQRQADTIAAQAKHACTLLRSDRLDRSEHNLRSLTRVFTITSAAPCSRLEVQSHTRAQQRAQVVHGQISARSSGNQPFRRRQPRSRCGHFCEQRLLLLFSLLHLGLVPIVNVRVLDVALGVRIALLSECGCRDNGGDPARQERARR